MNLGLNKHKHVRPASAHANANAKKNEGQYTLFSCRLSTAQVDVSFLGLCIADPRPGGGASGSHLSIINLGLRRRASEGYPRLRYQLGLPCSIPAESPRLDAGKRRRGAHGPRTDRKEDDARMGWSVLAV